MGDRTYVYYKVHPEDIARFLELAPELRDICGECDYADWNPSGPDVDDGLRFIEECNYAGGEDWQKMADAGIRFYGWSGSGCGYGEMDFHCAGDELRIVDAGHNGGYVVYPVDGELPMDQIDSILSYEESRIELCNLITEAWSLLPCNMAEKKSG